MSIDRVPLNLDTITPSDVLTSYTGKAHSCRCGCAGTYKCTAENRDLNAKRRGYAVSDDEVSDRSVKMTLNKLKHQHGLFPIDIFRGLGDEIVVDTQIGDRDATVYLVKR